MLFVVPALLQFLSSLFPGTIYTSLNKLNPYLDYQNTLIPIIAREILIFQNGNCKRNDPLCIPTNHCNQSLSIFLKKKSEKKKRDERGVTQQPSTYLYDADSKESIVTATQVDSHSHRPTRMSSFCEIR